MILTRKILGARWSRSILTNIHAYILRKGLECQVNRKNHYFSAARSEILHFKKLELRTMIYIILEHDPLVQSSCPNTVDLLVLTKLKLRLHELEKNPRK